MDNRAIGIFDSGLGGLTAAKALEELLPNENTVYFGDSANAPYGGREVAELRRLALRNAEFVASFGVKAILVACGTVTSTAMDLLREKIDLPIVGVVDAPCRAAAAATKNGKIGVIATRASIDSGLFARTLSGMKPDAEIFTAACSSFVPLVESGHYRADDPMVAEAVEKELGEIKAAGVDTLILGCTHFPLLSDAIAGYMGQGVELVFSSREAAAELAEMLRESGALCGSEKAAERLWYTSGDQADFSRYGELFLGHSVEAREI